MNRNFVRSHAAACLAAGTLGALALTSCSSTEDDGGGIDYSTAYLGSDGQIHYTGSTVPRKKKNRKLDVLKPAPETKWTWFGDGVPGDPSIVISVSSQTAIFYKGGVEVGRTQVSTGREGFSTPTGSFSVKEKSENHISSLYGDYVDSSGEVVMANIGIQQDKRPPGTRFDGAPMPYFLRVNGPVGMHAGYLPGFPASHGCIRLPHGAAMKFFENARVGTPVRIVP
jgi:hypothetical protein